MQKCIIRLIYGALSGLFFVLERILPWKMLYPVETPPSQSPLKTWRLHLILGPLKQRQTRAGALTIKHWIESEKCKCLAIIAPNAKRGRYELIEGGNGLLQLYKPSERPKYIKTLGKLIFKNGATAHLFGARQPDSMRGYDFDGAWVDQVCDMTHAKEMLFHLGLSVRQGQNPQIVLTTTLKDTSFMRRFIKLAETTDSMKVTYAESPRHTVAFKLTWALRDLITLTHNRLRTRLRMWEMTLTAWGKGMRNRLTFQPCLSKVSPYNHGFFYRRVCDEMTEVL